ncbi:excisionase family DNA-binding protein [Liquorilactobacillus nagelii]|jgi:excisionase family DNA binding protein|uniref:DNA-binding protein n=1 Tax=Liquorilactobacillus nagelii TaxID=82688 RepID=A0A3Q8CB74_9LACO|nr:excisionase family DNA-binding protein [Liquorilactobacillus nagelii]AUJ31344.1 DNA-binding protein [Liquorilactobacillus nagelii]MCC7616845.1 DNA-binding protein [Liquorilactobacillus nagelii]MCP9315563.1 excisionase family DNA-binding protein [Liquorilactobacillus nagelii]
MSLQNTCNQQNPIEQELVNNILNEVKSTLTQLTINNRYMNKQQTCAYLKISNNTLDKWIEYGLPFILVGSTRRFDRVAIDKWLNSRV